MTVVGNHGKERSEQALISCQALPCSRSLPLLSSIVAARTEETWAGSTPTGSPLPTPDPWLTVTGFILA